ncbi:unnamed protein product [Paramecium pentaurelia]|uniref:Calcium-dependent protein kinase 1 n=1 Tax=Paramecium pentaurelia TaxID=43138 RepID=A0A8S1SS75_9CILI|nr:unnamed protein product [Paramecium pentaurelia]
MGATCCKSNLQTQDELSVQSAAFGDNEQSSQKRVVKQTTANKRQAYTPAQTFGLGLKQNLSEEGKEVYDEPKKVSMVVSKELEQLLERQNSDTDRKKILEQQSAQKKEHKLNVNIDIFVQLKKGQISDHYITGQVLGEGAFGKVWKVTHKKSKLDRAMKQLKKSSILKEDKEKLFSEMNILKNLDHPNIVKLYELFEDDKNYYLVTEYCSGGELFDRIKKMNFFSEKKAAELMRQILSAVWYCHNQKIVHRDLKPENLLFVSDSPDADLKVIDFGTSRKFETGKRMTKRLGTPYYIAPEVLLENYNEKCDVWSCGIILYILLCGYPPFSGRSESDILKRVKAAQLKFDPEDWAHISEDAQNLIKNMLNPNPAKRISSEQAYNDKWIQNNAPSNQVNQKALQNLQQFHAKSKFKQAVLTFMATQIITQQEQDELNKTFQAIDKNGDGKLSRQELIDGYTSVTNNKELAIQQVDRIMELVDINRSGEVDFTEFLIAAMNQEKFLSVQKMEQAFKIIDLDGDNYISKAELQNVMGDVDDEIWIQILKECDSDNDGKISLEEFSSLLQSKVL